MSETVELELEFRAYSYTEIFFYDGARHGRLPISQIQNYTIREIMGLEPYSMIMVEVPTWLAKNEGLI